MLTIPVVEQCPYTVAGTGILRLSHGVLATFAGAVYDKREWLALLIGKRSTDGLDVVVDELRIPLQERGMADCALLKPEPLEPDVVGVVHSHHSMKAFFSNTDDTTLNPRFPVSIVVAQTSHGDSEIEELLGFCYKAEGRAPLPCGSIGIINYVVLPHPVVDVWPQIPTSGYGTPNPSISLHNCPHVARTREGLTHHCTTQCGVNSTEKAKAIFGRNGKSFLKEVEDKTRGHRFQGNVVITDNRKYFGKEKQGGFRSPRIDRSYGDEGGYWKHWSDF